MSDPDAALVSLPRETYTQLVESQKQLLDMQQRLARVQADFENARRRMERQQSEFQEYALGDLLAQLLQVSDNLERALGVVQTDPSAPPQWAQGVALVQKQLQSLLSQSGVERIQAVGQPFDPDCHHAVQQEQSQEVARETVVEEFQAGYRLKGRLLRPATVKVARPLEKDVKSEA